MPVRQESSRLGSPWVDWRSVWRWVAYGVLILAGLWLAFRLRVVLAPFLLALVITYVLEPPVTYLCRRGLSRTWSILVVYALVGLVIAGTVAFLVPGMIDELNRLAELIPQYTRGLQDLVRRLQADYARVPLPDTVRQALDESIVGMEQQLLDGIGGLVQGLMGAFVGAFTLVLAPFLAFYMIKDIEYFKRHLVALLPEGSRYRWLSLLGEADRVMSGFVRGQLILAAIIGATVALITWLLGLRFSILLGIIAGVGEFIPYFGPIIGSVPAAAVAALDSPATVIKLVVALLVLHQVEQAVIAPRVFRSSMGLHPLVVVFALLAGGHIFGLVGMILAVPAAGLVKIVLDHLWAAWVRGGGEEA